MYSCTRGGAAGGVNNGTTGGVTNNQDGVIKASTTAGTAVQELKGVGGGGGASVSTVGFGGSVRGQKIVPGISVAFTGSQATSVTGGSSHAGDNAESTSIASTSMQSMRSMWNRMKSLGEMRVCGSNLDIDDDIGEVAEYREQRERRGSEDPSAFMKMHELLKEAGTRYDD